MTRFAKIIGTGSGLPTRVVTNAELAMRVDTTDEWIKTRSGIGSRHIADEGTMTSDLATAAARNALQAASLDVQAVDLIIVATTTPDMVFPSTACIVQDKLGNTSAAAFDIQAVCSGFVYALTVAEKMITSGAHTTALVIGAEIYSRILDWTDRTTCVLFGDGAAAVVLTASDTPGILASDLQADGRHRNMLAVPGWVANGAVSGRPFVHMDGQAVFKFAVGKMAETCETTLARANATISEVDWLIPHQANIRIMNATGKKLGLPESKLIATVDHHGNTSAASIPLALDEAVRDGRIKSGHRLLLVGIGGGFTWGSVYLQI